jgi:hypothetical protein
MINFMKTLFNFLAFLVVMGSTFAQNAPQQILIKTNTGCNAITLRNLENMTFEFNGDCVDGLISGPGVGKLFSNGKPIYAAQGNYSKGFLNGFSKMKDEITGNTTEVIYKNGVAQDGPRVITFANGDRYVGDFKDGVAEGNGAYYYFSENPNKGNVYVGEFKAGKKHGKGTFTSANGSKYIGEYADGKLHGVGTLFAENGKILMQGKWVNDKFLTQTDASTASAKNTDNWKIRGYSLGKNNRLPCSPVEQIEYERIVMQCKVTEGTDSIVFDTSFDSFEVIKIRRYQFSVDSVFQVLKDAVEFYGAPTMAPGKIVADQNATWEDPGGIKLEINSRWCDQERRYLAAGYKCNDYGNVVVFQLTNYPAYRLYQTLGSEKFISKRKSNF